MKKKQEIHLIDVNGENVFDENVFVVSDLKINRRRVC